MDKDRWTPLHHAVMKSQTEVAKLLIQRGADPSKAFPNMKEILEFFRGDVDWWPEGAMKDKLMRTAKVRNLFGK